MSTKWLIRLIFSLGLLIGTPFTARAQQLYECTWIVTIRQITTTFESGAVETRWEYERVETCRPIQT